MVLLVREPLSDDRGALILTQQVGQLSNVRGNPQRLILGQENSHGTNLRPDPHHHHLARGCLDAEGICEHLNCVEHGMAWAETQRPLHPDDTVSWDCKLADGEPHPDSPQSESAPPADTTPALTVVPIPRPKPH